MSKKMLFIFNPRSGKGSIKTRLLDILDIFVKGGYEVTVHPTQAYMDGFKTAKKKAGDYDIVVASGGDWEVILPSAIFLPGVRMILLTACIFLKTCSRRPQIL